MQQLLFFKVKSSQICVAITTTHHKKMKQLKVALRTFPHEILPLTLGIIILGFFFLQWISTSN